MTIETKKSGQSGTGGKPPAKGRKRGRRSKGEGSVYWVESRGRWAVSATLPDGRRKTLYAETEAGALARLREIERAVDAGLPLTPERTSVGSYLKEWMAGYAPRVEATTADYRRGHVERYLVPELGSTKLARLTQAQVDAFYGRLMSDYGLSAQTVRHVHETLELALREAAEGDLVARNVASLAHPPRVPRREIAVWSVEEARAFLAHARTDRLFALYKVALTTGMRQGELLGLRWRDVDLAAGELSVQVALARTVGEPRLKPVKSRKSERLIRLNPATVEALREHRRRQVEERLASPVWKDWEGAGLVFATPYGTPMSSGLLWQWSWRRLRTAPQGEWRTIRFHDLRHTAATLMLRDKVHPKVVSERLGHASVGFTLDIYSHVLPDMQQDAAAAMERLLG